MKYVNTLDVYLLEKKDKNKRDLASFIKDKLKEVNKNKKDKKKYSSIRGENSPQQSILKMINFKK